MAKLTTRTLTTTTVSADNIPKNAGLTHQEMDSNFLNLNTDKLENTTDDFTGTLSVKGAGASAVGAVRYYDQDDSNYVDKRMVSEEIVQAKKYFENNKWPVIDVTRKSIEETAAEIMLLYRAKKSHDN